MSKPKTYLRFLAPLLLAAGAALLWLPQPLLQATGYAAISSQAEQVVDDVTKQNLAAFAAVSTIKTGLAIIEDSSVGVGFQIQVGDAVQAVYDYVDFVWESLLYSLLILSAYKMLLETQLLHLGLQMMGAGFLLGGVALLLPRATRPLGQLAPRVVFAGALFAYVVPLALLMMHFATTHYTGPLKEKQAQRINEVRTEVERLSGQFGELKGSIDVLHPLDTASALRAQVSQITTSLSTSVSQSTQAMLYYVVIILFELLIFPVLTALFLYKLLQIFFGKVLERVVPVKPTTTASVPA